MDRFLYLQQSFPDRKDLSFHVQGSVPVCTYCRDTGRNSCQFLFCCNPGRGNCHSSLVFSKDFQNPGALPCGTEQSPEICPCTSSDCMSVAIFGSVINLYSGFCQADPEKLKLIETLGGHKKEKLTKIILPASLPLIISVMKVNIGLCLVGVIIGEFIGARKGLGYLIIYGSQTFKLTWVLMSIMILCIIAMGLYAVLNLLEKYIQTK